LGLWVLESNGSTDDGVWIYSLLLEDDVLPSQTDTAAVPDNGRQLHVKKRLI